MHHVVARVVPERIGEPSLIKHVVYIVKENKTYDQVYGDMPQGRGMPQLCVYGDSVTPNQHKLSGDFSLLDNYYASGKCSAEGHQWADAAMTSDYIRRAFAPGSEAILTGRRTPWSTTGTGLSGMMHWTTEKKCGSMAKPV